MDNKVDLKKAFQYIGIALVLQFFNLDFNTGISISTILSFVLMIVAILSFKKALPDKNFVKEIVLCCVAASVPLFTFFTEKRLNTPEITAELEAFIKSISNIDISTEEELINFLKEFLNNFVKFNDLFLITIVVNLVLSFISNIAIYFVNNSSALVIKDNEKSYYLTKNNKQYLITSIISNVLTIVIVICSFEILLELAKSLGTADTFESLATSSIIKYVATVSLLSLPLSVCGIWNLVVFIKCITVYFKSNNFINDEVKPIENDNFMMGDENN